MLTANVVCERLGNPSLLLEQGKNIYGYIRRIFKSLDANDDCYVPVSKISMHFERNRGVRDDQNYELALYYFASILEHYSLLNELRIAVSDFIIRELTTVIFNQLPPIFKGRDYQLFHEIQDEFPVFERLKIRYCPLFNSFETVSYFKSASIVFNEDEEPFLSKVIESSNYFFKENGVFYLLRGLRFYTLREESIVELGYLPSSYTPGNDGFWLKRHEHLCVDNCPLCGKIKYINKKFCWSCMRKYIPTGKLINPYSTKVPNYLTTLYHPEDKKNSAILFGVELELEHKTKRNLEADVEKIYFSVPNFIIAKQDGSIHSGVEFVTTPATFKIQKEKMKDIFTELKSTEFIDKQNCGVHIHVGRKELTELQIGRICEWLYNPENEDLIYSISGRRESSYARLNKDGNLLSCAPAYSRQSHERYSALNLNNKHTIEFRLFASTIQYEVMCRYLEFVYSLIKFTTPGVANISKISEISKLEPYIEFVKFSNVFNIKEKKKEKEFRYLYDHLVATNHIHTPKKGI